MILLITGPMASGKSTVAELLAESLHPSVHLQGDVFRRMIKNGRVEMSESPSIEALKQLDLRYRITAEAARLYHQAGFVVIVQDNYYGVKLSQMLDLLSPEEVKVFILCPSIEAIHEREESRNKVGYKGFSIQQLYKIFVETTPRLGKWIDNTDQSPEKTVKMILENL